MKGLTSKRFTAVLVTHLKRLRINAGLTQRQLADRIQQTQSFVSKYETGEQRLDMYQLKGICETCGMKLSFFIKKLEDDCQC